MAMQQCLAQGNDFWSHPQTRLTYDSSLSGRRNEAGKVYYTGHVEMLGRWKGVNVRIFAQLDKCKEISENVMEASDDDVYLGMTKGRLIWRWIASEESKYVGHCWFEFRPFLPDGRLGNPLITGDTAQSASFYMYPYVYDPEV